VNLSIVINRVTASYLRLRLFTVMSVLDSYFILQLHLASGFNSDRVSAKIRMVEPSVTKKHSARTLGFNAVAWSCLGGAELGRGMHQFVLSRWQYDWITSLLMGAAFLGFAIFWVVLLVRRVNQPITV
jgi:hypothetical protein